MKNGSFQEIMVKTKPRRCFTYGIYDRAERKIERCAGIRERNNTVFSRWVARLYLGLRCLR